VFPVFGGEIVESEQGLAILCQAFGGLLVFRHVGRDEGVERGLGILAGLKRALRLALYSERSILILAEPIALVVVSRRTSRCSPAAGQKPSRFSAHLAIRRYPGLEAPHPRDPASSGRCDRGYEAFLLGNRADRIDGFSRGRLLEQAAG
jgi:hypothetical protein